MHVPYHPAVCPLSGQCSQLFIGSSNLGPDQIGQHLAWKIILHMWWLGGTVSLRITLPGLEGHRVFSKGCAFNYGKQSLYMVSVLCLPHTVTAFVNICLWKVAFLDIMAWSSKPIHKWIFSAHGNLLHLNIKIHWRKGRRERKKWVNKYKNSEEPLGWFQECPTKQVFMVVWGDVILFKFLSFL